jgi:flagellar hook-basal body complex protein FliE
MNYPEQESIAVAEQAVIGSILLDGHIFYEVEAIISSADFASKDLAVIFTAFKELTAESVEITVVSTSEYLGRTGKLDKIGGPVKLMDLCDNIGSSSQAVYYAGKVLEASTAREYAKTCKLFQIESKQASEGKAKFSDILSKHLQELNKIQHFAKDNCNKIDWFNAKPDNVYQVIWPMGIHEWVNIFPKNIAVIGGASNAGKTAFLLNVAYDNRLKQPVKYFSSEMGPEELRLRLQLFGHRLRDWECIEFLDRSSNFAPAIDPDALNIIDYLEITDNFYQIGGEIKQIFDRLRSGIAVIGIQKKAGTDYARGGEFTLEKARLYMALDYNVAKIVKGKNWGIHGNPKDIEFHFNLNKGCMFEFFAVKDADGNFRE